MILNATLPQKHEEVTAALSNFFFWQCALNSIYLGEGKGRASIVWYPIVSYQYTMQILSLIPNHLLLVLSTSNQPVLAQVGLLLHKVLIVSLGHQQ